jgi:hypothetical protein
MMYLISIWIGCSYKLAYDNCIQLIVVKRDVSKLHVVGGDIVRIFYILESPLFCIHHNPKVRSLSFHQPRTLIKVTPLMVLCLPSPIFNVFHFAIPYFLLKDFKHVNLFLTMVT